MNRPSVLGVAALVILGATAAPAVTMSQAASIELSLSPDNYNYLFQPTSIKQFDPTLGTLNAISITLNQDYSYTATMVSPDPINACCVYGNIQLGFSFDGLQTNSDDVGLALPGKAGTNTKSETGSFHFETGWMPFNLDAFDDRVVGEGYVPAFFDGEFWLFHEVDGSGIFTASGHADIRVVVSYEYDPVPEPASWLMMLGGFGLIGSAKRYHRKQLGGFV